MGLSEKIKNELRASFDYDNGGRLTYILDKACALDAPILVIGLGGTGGNALIRLKKMVNDRMERKGNNSDAVCEKPDNIEYLFIDTDSSYDDLKYDEIGFNEGLRESLIFTSGSISLHLRSPILADHIKNWINPNICASEVIYGAGAIRQIGRFMFFDNLAEIKDVIQDKIKRVSDGYSSNVPLYVFVLSGTCGGTGSAILFDVSYLVWAIAHDLDSSRIVLRTGMLFMPDVNFLYPGLNNLKKEILEANGFATLKELDHLMNIPYSGDVFEQDYGNLYIGKGSGGDRRPLDLCILISSKDERGQTHSYDDTLNMTVRSLFDLITASSEMHRSDVPILPRILSELEPEKRAFLSMLGSDIHPVNYNYFGLGGSCAFLPRDDIMSYMAFLAFYGIKDKLDMVPTVQQVEDMADKLRITEKRIVQGLCESLPKISGLDKYTFEYIRQDPDSIINEFKNNLNMKCYFIEQKSYDLFQTLKNLLNSDYDPLKDIFTDPAIGPVFASRMVSAPLEDSGIVKPCIISFLREMTDSLARKIPSADTIRGFEMEVEIAKRELMIHNPLLPRIRDELRNRLLQALDELYEAKFRKVLYERVQRLCGEYIDLFAKKNEETYSGTSDLVQLLAELFAKYEAIGEPSNEDQNEERNLGGFLIFDVSEIATDLKNSMETDPDWRIDFIWVIKIFYEYLYENIDMLNDNKKGNPQGKFDWFGSEKGDEKTDIAEKLNYLFSNEFVRVLYKPMDYFIEYVANVKGKPADILRQSIYRELEHLSVIMFPISDEYKTPILNPTFSVVSVPHSAYSMEYEIRKRMDTMAELRETDLNESMIMTRFMQFIPIAGHSDISKYSRSYEDHKQDAGLHLYESDKIDWHSLPSPLPSD
ncbi:MAG: tubulin-like doman-containing protein [Lachnospiraceae bacterium]|nr:tubulin-like doman-containing protein [Lachnospiraceae bacterium]